MSGSTIADILLEAGRQAADARRASGSILGQAVSNIGQLPGQVIAEKRQNDLAAAKSADDAQERTLRGAQIKDIQDAQGKRTKLDQVWASGLINEDGSINLAKARTATQAQGVPDAYPDFEEMARKWDKGQTDLAESKAKAAEANLQLEDLTKEHLGSSGLDIQNHGNDPHYFAVFVAKHATPKDGLLDPNDAETLLQNAQTPEAVKQITDGWIQNSPSYARSHTPAALTEQKLKDAQLLEAQQKTLGTVPETPAQKSERMNREAMLTFEKMRIEESKRHNLATEQAANPFGVSAPSGAGTPATTGPTGDAFLKTLDPGTAEEVKAYAEGRRPFPTGMSMARLQPLIKLVGQYDPTFDAANYNARNKARSDFQSPSGTGGKTINALNTALQHAGKLSDLIETLDNSEYPLYNAVANPIRSASGKTEVTNYQAVAPQLAKEIERAWRGSGGSQADIQELISSIGKNMGKQQQREALSNFVDLVKGKLDATEQQRDNVMGAAGKTIPILFEQNKAMIDKIEQRASGSAAQPVGRYNPATGKIENGR